MSTKDNPSEIFIWGEYAKKDLIASRILYKNDLINHSIYFLFQAIEKMQKIDLMSKSIIKSGKEISHNLRLGTSKWIKQSILKKIKEYRLNVTKNSDLSDSYIINEKEKQKIIGLIRKDENLMTMIKGHAILEKIKPIDQKKNVEKLLSTLDSELEKMNKMKKELFKESSNDLFFESLNRFLLSLYSYPSYIIYELSPYIPEQDALRYPDKFKFDAFNSVWGKNFKKIYLHTGEALKSQMLLLKLSPSFFKKS